MPISARAKAGAGLLVGPNVSWKGLVWLALAIIGALPLFWFGLAGLAVKWARPEYSHGPVIPLLSFYLFLRETRAVPPVPEPVTDRWAGVAVIALALALAAFGNLVQIDDLVFYSLIVWTAGLILTGFGFRRGWVFWPAVLHLVFMLPLPQVVYWKVSTALQLVSSDLGVDMLRLMGVPVFLDGNIIDLGVYQLQVAEACSGLRYLFPIMSFTYVFCFLYRGPLWHRLALLLAAVPLAVMMNALRIAGIGWLVDRHGIGQAEGFLHVFEGWVVFLTCIGILFLMAMAMQRLSGDRRRLGEALDLDFSGIGGELARVLSMPASRALVAAACLTVALSLLWTLLPSRTITPPDRDPYALFPHQIDGWSGTTAPLAPKVEEILGADDYVSVLYQKPGEAASVDLFLSYYFSQTAGNAIHSPEICLPSSGWEVSSIAPVTVKLPGTQAGSVRLNRVIIQKGTERQLVYYWFGGRGRHITNDIAVKLYTLADTASRGRSDGGLVRLITSTKDGEAAAEARLQRFLAATVDRLPRFLPD